MSSFRVVGRPGRTLVLRLSPGTDLYRGVRDACEAEGVRAGAVSAVIGGVGRAAVEVGVASASSPVGVVAREIEIEGPLAILCAQGMICEAEDGTVAPHIHISFVDGEGVVHGGHLVEGRAPVTTTADVIIEEVLGARFGRKLDPEVGAVLFFPEPST